MAGVGEASQTGMAAGRPAGTPGLAVSDRIRLTIGADSAVAGAVRAHAGFVAAETLAVALEARPPGKLNTAPHPLADTVIKLALTREPGDGGRPG